MEFAGWTATAYACACPASLAYAGMAAHGNCPGAKIMAQIVIWIPL